jgi:anhydro-N-acetylmuramic acid kinase
VLAQSGNVNDDLLKRLMDVLPLPLTQAYGMDNTWVKEQYLPILENTPLRIEDKLATVTEFIARSVALQVSAQELTTKSHSLFISGGGAHNNYLVERIRECVFPVDVFVPSPEIVDFKEAMLMALCGMLRLMGKPNAFASVTGARYDTVNGRITHAQKQS